MEETIHFGNHVPRHGEGQRLAGNIEKAHGKIQKAAGPYNIGLIVYYFCLFHNKS